MATFRFISRHLDPADRLAEVMCGLVMVLTFTLTAGLTAGSGEEAVHSLLLDAVGCNIAWGIIDGVLYVLSRLSQRGARARLAVAVQAAPDVRAALELLRERVGPTLLGLATAKAPAAAEGVLHSLRNYLEGATVPKTTVTRDDLSGALAVLLLNLVACFPAVVPFLFLRDPVTALRASNAILVVLLFLVGQQWGHFAQVRRFLAGLTMAAIGLALVGVAALLGG